MPYVGRNTDKLSNIEVLDAITFDGSSSYTLQKNSVNFTPSSANNVLVSIDGVVQANNFTVSGSTIDFGVAVPATSTCDWIYHIGVGLITTPADGTVTTAKLADASVTSAKLASNAVDTQTLSLFNATGSAPVYACRAWVNFNGTGTVAIRDSGNVSSITDNGTGSYTANFTTAMPDANFCVVSNSNDAYVSIAQISVVSTNTSVYTRYDNGAAADQSYVTIAVFR